MKVKKNLIKIERKLVSLPRTIHSPIKPDCCREHTNDFELVIFKHIFSTFQDCCIAYPVVPSYVHFGKSVELATKGVELDRRGQVTHRPIGRKYVSAHDKIDRRRARPLLPFDN